MRMILDRLMLCDLSEANDPFFLTQNQVQAILYFGSGGMFPDDIKLYHRQAEPDGSLSREQLRDGIDFLRESLRAGRRVLAVGPTGATIAAAYLSEMGFSSAQALQMLAQDDGAAPAPDVDFLSTHEQELHQRGAASLWRN